MRHAGWVVLVLSASLGLGCSGNSDTQAVPEQCTIGASVACACTDGRTGAQVCLADHTLGACLCTTDSGTGSDVPVPPLRPDAAVDV
jgi:hypothetical protein